MEEMVNVTNQTPIEIALGIDEDGNTTAKKLYAFLELAPQNFSRWCKTNITDNEFATEDEDFVRLLIDEETPTGGKVQREDYKLTAHFAKKLSMKGGGARAEEAREYFSRVEEKAKEAVLDRSQLPPSMQIIYAMVDEQAKIVIEQKKQAEKVERIETQVKNIKDIMIKPIGDWRSEINEKVREISIKSGIGYQELYLQMYAELESTAHCSLERLQNFKHDRMEKAGNTKTCIKRETTRIAIIEEKPQLKAIFEGIVKRYAMAYCV